MWLTFADLMNKKSKYIQIVRYIFAGGFVTFFNIALLFLFVHNFKLWYLTGAFFAFIFSVTLSYLLQKFWTFKNYSTKGINKQFFNFFIFALVMLSFNTLLMYFFVDIFGIWYLLAQVLTSAIIAFINYTYFNKVIFKNILID